MPVIVARRELMVALGAAAAWPLAAAFALAPAVSCPALAQGWPARSVRIVVPYAPGGGSTDTVARLLSSLRDAVPTCGPYLLFAPPRCPVRIDHVPTAAMQAISVP